MEKYKLFFLLITSLILFHCKKNELPIDEYMTATIDGADYIAQYKSARLFSDEDGRDWLQIGSANISTNHPVPNPNAKGISFSILNDCLKPGTYNMEFIQKQCGSYFIPFSYAKYLNDSAFMSYMPLEGSISIEQLEYKKNGIVKGTFEFKFTYYTDTTWIKNGKFQLKIVD